ncbi:MAG: hypothetical protein A6F71_00850 [Cycloclasticus sp. symbiont of Poecilosclerida sp. M]|nr:MAG: hypothetical protein A6F71_00850 [Cycloclasticus sp. symbiont of Poecilosclerida sp. M]
MSSVSSKYIDIPQTLPSAVEFEDLGEHLLCFSARAHAKVVMLYIKFDGLVESINKKQNNLALQAITERLLLRSRESDIYAHIQGMEFANLSIQTSENHVAIVVEKLKNKLAEPIFLDDGSRIKLNAKIGIAEYPANGSTHQDLLYVASRDVH